MVTKVDGFAVAYTHRGSWKAKRTLAGEVIDEISVAWTRDYTAGREPMLIIWFKDDNEASERLEAGDSFVTALSEKKVRGASAKDIRRLLEVHPVETVAPTSGTRSGLRCKVIGKAK